MSLPNPADLIRQMADQDIRLLCYNFMAGTDWCRTVLDAPERGAAKVTAFRLADVEQAQIIAFLKTLTDDEFIRDRRFSEQ